MPTVVFVIERYGLYLMEQRPDSDRYMPGELAFPGGKIEDGESPFAAVLREMQEEVGLDTSLEAPIGRFTVMGLDERHLAEPPPPIYLIPDVPQFRVYPFLVELGREFLLEWHPPDVNFDSGHQFQWVALHVPLASRVRGVREIGWAVESYRRQRREVTGRLRREEQHGH